MPIYKLTARAERRDLALPERMSEAPDADSVASGRYEPVRG